MDPRYKKLDPFLHRISTSLSLNEKDTKCYNSMLQEVFDNLLPKMKEKDPLFNELFRQVRYSGSYYENLRIQNPDEYDINIELKLPVKNYEMNTECLPGFLTLKILEFKENVQSRVKTWCDSSQFLLRSKVLQWFMGVVDKALQSLNMSSYKIKRSTSGPAITLFITCVDIENHTFSVDLVPVFNFGLSDWPKHPIRQPKILESTHATEWCIVPKSYNSANVRLWRMSFYNQEKCIMNNQLTLKNVLKVIKSLRDREQWHCLSSYYIKTVFLWTAEENSRKDIKIWKYSVGMVFMYMMSRLKYYLNQGEIPFFWNSECNLLISVNDYEKQKISNRIDRIIKKIDSNVDADPSIILTFFSPVTVELEAQPFASSSTDIKQLQSTEEIGQEQEYPQRQQTQNPWLQVLVPTVIGAIALGAFTVLSLRDYRRQ